MTKKHFEAVAQVFRQRLAEGDTTSEGRVLLASVVSDLADEFAKFNPHFDKERFINRSGFVLERS